MKHLTFALMTLASLTSCGRKIENLPSPSQMQNEVKASVVRIVRGDGGMGTGWVGKGGKTGRKYIITNAHVCEGTNSYKVEWTGAAKPHSRTEWLTDISYDRDLCLINLSNQKEPALEFSKEPLHAGDPLWVVGHALGRAMSARDGMAMLISTVQIPYPTTFCKPEEVKAFMTFFGVFEGCIKKMRAMEITAQVYPGNSGGPIMNKDGKVAAMVFASDELGGSALPYSSVKAFLNSH